ncbi:hydrogenase expression/formation protein HypE [Lachnoclostridium sp. Marseille-P6806]|uniref:hydrogenase expression/formation protein HypE n=1 Tax=Lachnoclostridium sp. Marseille-P6806 TaxID=2364793 RepID=UPI001030285E|nr:hydrogenase expression/formation protein HypE [Lachnoclostridium sp. Marseille-P6806]
MQEPVITMAHGSGGDATGRLIAELFAEAFHNEYLDRMEDASVLPGSGRIAMTTDSFVVSPHRFPGGDIGRLSVCGTVNDLLTSGAEPRYLTAGFILEEGLALSELRAVVQSMAETAREAGVLIVTGDTKVVEPRRQRGGILQSGLMINTAGVGFIPEGRTELGAAHIEDGDVILVSGTLGEHHAAIMAGRMGLENASLFSDNAPLGDMAGRLLRSGVRVHAMRDVTRGGLATVLGESARAAGLQITVEENRLPVQREVADFCGIMGLDPLYMGNEGKLVIAVAPEDAERALALVRGSRYGERAERIGFCRAVPEGEEPLLLLQTAIGGRRVLGPLYGEGLPRIC